MIHRTISMFDIDQDWSPCPFRWCGGIPRRWCSSSASFWATNCWVGGALDASYFMIGHDKSCMQNPSLFLGTKLVTSPTTVLTTSCTMDCRWRIAWGWMLATRFISFQSLVQELQIAVVRGFLGNKEVGLRWFLAYSQQLRAAMIWRQVDEVMQMKQHFTLKALFCWCTTWYTVLCSTVNVADYCWYCWVVSIATSLDFWSWLYVRVYVRSWVPVPEWQFAACKLCAVLGNQWPRWWVGLSPRGLENGTWTQGAWDDCNIRFAEQRIIFIFHIFHGVTAKVGRWVVDACRLSPDVLRSPYWSYWTLNIFSIISLHVLVRFAATAWHLRRRLCPTYITA